MTVCFLAMKKCHKDRFKCQASSECILKSWQCDGEEDCSDGSDERNCKQKKCKKNQFTCYNADCIAGALRCDGKVDCADKSDELNCPAKKCFPGFVSIHSLKSTAGEIYC